MRGSERRQRKGDRERQRHTERNRDTARDMKTLDMHTEAKSFKTRQTVTKINEMKDMTAEGHCV